MSKYPILIIMLFVACNAPDWSRKKVMVVHVRGLSYPLLNDYLDQSNNFMSVDRSKYLKPLEPIVNAVTISNIASFETGTYPAGHGIVGHLYVKQFDSLHLVSGFSQRFEIPSFWEVADLAGKQVLNVGALTLHGKYESHVNVDVWAQGQLVAGPEIIHLVPCSEYAERLCVVDGNTDLRFYLPDSMKGILTIDNDTFPYNGFIGQLSEGNWLEIIDETENRSSSSSRIKWIETRGDTLKLYQRASFVSRGYPDSFIDQMNSLIGPSMGWPNITGYTSASLSLETLLEEIDAEMDQLMNAFRAATTNKNYDLISVDYPMMDRYGHLMYDRFNGVVSSDTLINRLFNRIIRDLTELNAFASQHNYEIIIASGHGFSEIHSSINMNRWLSEMGIRSDMNDSSWQAFGVPGKVSGQIYFNPNMSDIEKINLHSRMLSAATNERYQPFIDKIYLKEDLNEIGLDHQHAGEVFVMLKPGFVFSNDLSEQNDLFGKPYFRGDHGYLPQYPESQGFIYTRLPCEQCRVTDIARIVTSALGI